MPTLLEQERKHIESYLVHELHAIKIGFDRNNPIYSCWASAIPGLTWVESIDDLRTFADNLERIIVKHKE